MKAIVPYVTLIFLMSNMENNLTIKVLKTPKFHTGDPPADSFATFSKTEEASTSELTICLWVLNFYKEDSWFLEEVDKRGFRLSVVQTEIYGNIAYWNMGE